MNPANTGQLGNIQMGGSMGSVGAPSAGPAPSYNFGGGVVGGGQQPAGGGFLGSVDRNGLQTNANGTTQQNAPMDPQQRALMIGNLPPPQPPGGFAQRFGQLHPQAQQALRNMPPDLMDHLHQAGMIHPEMMGHLRGGGQSNFNGAQY